MSSSLLSLPLLLSLSPNDWIEQDGFPPDPLIGRFRVVEIYPRPLSLRHPEIRITDPLLHLHQRVSIEHIGESEYFSQPAEEYRFIFHGLPLSAAADNAGLPPPTWQDSPQATLTATATVISYSGSSNSYARFGARSEDLTYVAAFAQPGPEARLYVTQEGDLIWEIFIDIKPELQRDFTSLTISFRLKREG